MRRSEFLSKFNFENYVRTKFSQIFETSDEDRVRVICPFCSDRSGHLYILISAGLPYCQRCNYNPKSPIRFISDLELIPIGEVVSWADGNDFVENEPVRDLIDNILNGPEESEFETTPLLLGDEFVPVLSSTGISPVDSALSKALSYLRSRGISDDLIKQFDIRFSISGKFSGRVVIPCYYEGKVVSFVARDIFNTRNRKYLNPLGNKQSDFLFNFDGVSSDCVVLTEGVFDAINISRILPAVASFGKKLSRRQIHLLNRFSRVIFYWDADAYSSAEKYAALLSVPSEVVLHPDSRDAAARTLEQNEEVLLNTVSFSSVKYQLFKMDITVN